MQAFEAYRVINHYYIGRISIYCKSCGHAIAAFYHRKLKRIEGVLIGNITETVQEYIEEDLANRVK